MKTFYTCIKAFLLLTLLTGVIYPLAVTGIAQLLFHDKANGSLIKQDNHIIGSELIGQEFKSSRYFWSRPSAINYNPLPSGGSNLGPTSKQLQKQTNMNRINFVKNNFLSDQTTVPSEMIFASGSGLDPHISRQAALLQVSRIAKARKLTSSQKETIVRLIYNSTERPQFGLLGQERINVFLLNLELDKTLK